MATDVNLPDGFELDQDQQNFGLPPGFELDSQAQQPDSFLDRAVNTVSGAKEWIGNKLAPLAPAMQSYEKSQFGSPFQLAGSVQPLLSKVAGKAGQAVTEELSKPHIRYFREKPYDTGSLSPNIAAGIGTAISMAPDVMFAAAPGSETSFGQKAVTGIYRKVSPSILKSTKGIPPEVSRMAIDNPEVMKLAGTSESVQGKSQNIIDAIKEARTKVGEKFGKEYSTQNIENPVDQIIAGNKSEFGNQDFESLRQQYHQAKSGEIFRRPGTAGGYTQISDQEKLAKLTDLKRALQNKANYPPPGTQLSPSEGAHNAAIEKMAADIDNLRGKIPGGENLALADDAWSEMTELKHRLMSAFKDPYTGQDYLNRILKGNTDWLTSGRMAGKVGAIERIEQITGRKVLKPALEEMAAAYLKNPDSMGLPSTRLEAIITSIIPKKALLTPPNMKTKLFSSVGKGAIVNSGRLFKEKTPKPLFASNSESDRDREEIKPNSYSPPNDSNSNGDQNNGQDNTGRNTKNTADHSQISLTKEKAREFLAKAKGNKSLARKLAKEAGYLW